MPFLGVDPAAGTIERTRVPVGRYADGSDAYIPVVVARGAGDGPTTYLQAGVHGDEATGIEVLRQVLERIDPANLAGRIVAVPIANIPAYLNRSRHFVHEERAPIDMNRIFPGRAHALLTERIAAALTTEFMHHADQAIDFHSALAGCTIASCVYVGVATGHPVHERQVRIAELFDLDFICFKEGKLQTGATNLTWSFCSVAASAGIPAVIAEMGESERVTWEYVPRGVAGTMRVLADAGHFSSDVQESASSVTPTRFTTMEYVHADTGGLVLPRVHVGEHVKPGSPLAVLVDPVTAEERVVCSSSHGVVFRQMLWASCHTGAELVWIARRLDA